MVIERRYCNYHDYTYDFLCVDKVFYSEAEQKEWEAHNPYYILVNETIHETKR